MSTTYWTTLISAVVVVGFAVLGLGIGWLLTGKSHLNKRCGWTPSSKEKDEGGCTLCGSQKKCSTLQQQENATKGAHPKRAKKQKTK